MGGRSVRVFHISDLHMRSMDGPQANRARLEAGSRWRVLGEKWSANLAAIREDGTPVDLVVFTGDLGDWGYPTDYPRALAFLTQTCEALAVPIERLFVIPGNHDIVRTVQRAAWESLRHDVARDPQACSRWLAGEDRGALRGMTAAIGSWNGSRPSGPRWRPSSADRRMIRSDIYLDTHRETGHQVSVCPDQPKVLLMS